MTSTPVSLKNEGKPEMPVVAAEGISVGLGILWIVGVAAVWNVVLVLFHDVMARLLS
jgi:hypothetical protein